MRKDCSSLGRDFGLFQKLSAPVAVKSSVKWPSQVPRFQEIWQKICIRIEPLHAGLSFGRVVTGLVFKTAEW
jgi:hypothetical protein